jgi:hypothetical protein
MRPRTKALLVALGIAVFLTLAALFVRSFLRVDDCLDNGGSWDSKLDSCEGERPE